MEKKISNTMKKVLAGLPEGPGVYKMQDSKRAILYIGKAKNLKKRVSSYFLKNSSRTVRTKKMMGQVADISWLVTDTELEAYILETNLIKELRPRYNILMKDDKNFLYLKISVQETFPRIQIVRKVVKDGAKYFGPKTNGAQVYETFRMLKKILPFRHCQLDIIWKTHFEERADREQHPENVEVTNRVIDFPCLDFFIKRCPGPCVGCVSPEEYRKTIDLIIHFLDGKGDEILRKLKEQMARAATEKKFEQAGRLRDTLFAVEKLLEKQKISDPDRKDTDIVHCAVEMGKAFFALFRIRGGKLIDTENFIVDILETEKNNIEDSEILGAFLSQYYEKSGDIPREIFIPSSFDDRDIFQRWLSETQKKSVKIIIPERGEKNKLLELCRKNAESYMKQCRIKWMAKEAQSEALQDLATALELPNKSNKSGKTPLKRIECFDISHIGGQDTVGSMIVFENGFPKKEHYRHFALRTVHGKPNDFESMKEILSRRLKYLVKHVDPKISFRAATKKDLVKIKKSLDEQNRSTENLKSVNCIVAKRNKKIIGFGRLHELSKKVIEISGLTIIPEERGKKLGYEIIKRLLQKTKAKRVYVDCTKDLEEYYAVFGFRALIQHPPEFEEKLKKIRDLLESKSLPVPEWNPCFMVFDKIKHKIDPSFESMPNLIIVDGGKPQLSAALKALDNYHLNIPVIGLAKRFEEVYLPGKSAPYLFEKGEEALKLLQRIRDEAHRFAITYGRELHRKNLIS